MSKTALTWDQIRCDDDDDDENGVYDDDDDDEDDDVGGPGLYSKMITDDDTRKGKREARDRRCD
jgi:hypothetical protein